MNDPIADMITRIKNASDLRKESVVLPYSKLKLAILDVLLKEGFIKSFGKKGKKIAKFIDVGLIVNDGRSRISGAERVSKTSKRIYMQSKDIRTVKNGYGLLVLSTPKGIVTGKFAKENNLGGEALLKIW
jgi:small subunit ribosomal protein S8